VSPGRPKSDAGLRAVALLSPTSSSSRTSMSAPPSRSWFERADGRRI
jgi:hypothetical protein